MARFASSEELARVSYAVAIAEGLKFIADGGMEVWAVRAIGRAPGHDEVVRRTSSMAAVKLLFGCACGAAAGAFTYWIGHVGALLALVSGLFVLAGEAFGIGPTYYLASGAPGKLLPVSILYALVVGSVSVVALAKGANATSVCAMLAGGELLAAAYVLIKLRSERVLARFPGIFSSSMAAVRQALPTTIYSGLAAVYLRLDAVFLNAASAAAFATYTVAFRATQPFGFVFGAIALAAYTAHVSEPTRHDAASPLSLRKLLGYIFAAASVAAIATYLVCAWLIGNLVPQYADSLDSLQVLCALIPLFALNNVMSYVLIGNGMNLAVIGVVSMNLVCAAVSLWLLVPAYGALGAALSLLGTQLLSGAVMWMLLTRPHLQTAPA